MKILPKILPKFVVLLLFVFYFDPRAVSAENKDFGQEIWGDNVRAVYLAGDFIRDEKKIQYLEGLIKDYNINAVVIDVKDSGVLLDERMKIVHSRFKNLGVYTIARIVTFQDSKLAKQRPDLAIKMSNGEFWYSGSRKWKRWWVDPASEGVWDYNIGIAKKAIDIGFDEIQFDYIRFPTDGPKDKVYPIWDGRTPKDEVMKKFFARIRKELKTYKPEIKISIDVFGEVFLYSQVKEIGQSLETMHEYFDVISPMAYPSHYSCGEFKYYDPNTEPYGVYFKTLKPGIDKLKGLNSRAKVRPWVQAFSIRNIYGCGGTKTIYGGKEIRKEIKAGKDLGVFGWMLWNPSSSFEKSALDRK